MIDFVARDLDELLAQVDGRKVTVRGQAIKLAVAGATVETIVPDWRTKLLAMITNPSFALILLMLGIYGMLFEFSNPGFVLPGRGRRDLPAARAVRVPDAAGELRRPRADRARASRS